MNAFTHLLRFTLSASETIAERLRGFLDRAASKPLPLDNQTAEAQWLHRWDMAMKQCWSILGAGAVTKRRFERFERNHRRLMRLTYPGKNS